MSCMNGMNDMHPSAPKAELKSPDTAGAGLGLLGESIAAAGDAIAAAMSSPIDRAAVRLFVQGDMGSISFAMMRGMGGRPQGRLGCPPSKRLHGGVSQDEPYRCGSPFGQVWRPGVAGSPDVADRRGETGPPKGCPTSGLTCANALGLPVLLEVQIAAVAAVV